MHLSQGDAETRIYCVLWSTGKVSLFQRQVEEARSIGNFTDLQILQHLQDKLKDPAFDAVHGALLSDGSLNDVLETLEVRFGNRFILTQTVTEKLLSWPKIRNGEVESLSVFCSEAYNAMSVLDTRQNWIIIKPYRRWSRSSHRRVSSSGVAMPGREWSPGAS